MNTYFKTFISLCLFSLIVSCNKDIEGFSGNENFIYFDVPFVLDQYNKPTKERLDTIKYTFALEESDYKTHVIDIPVNTISLPADHDRSYKVEIVREETTAGDDEWDISSIENLSVKAGCVTDTIRMVVNRKEIMSREFRTVTLRMVPNDNFQEGVPALLNVKVTFSDILSAPDYWSKIKDYVGSIYYKEVYRKWMEIYYEGADPNTEPIKYAPTYGKPLWHGNMPFVYDDLERDYPSTVLFLKELQRYFRENDIYPDGDTTKDPIRIP